MGQKLVTLVVVLTHTYTLTHAHTHPHTHPRSLQHQTAWTGLQLSWHPDELWLKW